MSLTWKGAALKTKMRTATISGVNTTMGACIIHAKANHGGGGGRFQTQTGNLERSTRIMQQAKRVGRFIVGKWGSIGANSARRIEFGFQGQDARGASVNAPALPFLFPAARVEYPKLAARIKRAF